MLRIDQVLNQRYRIVRQLGHGGMGAVYEAIDERFGEPIALKEIVFASSSENQKDLVTKAFEREAKALAKAQHEVIPYVRDYFSEVDRQFLVMELVEGDDLGELLSKRQSPFPLLDCLKWLDQLLDALDYLHTLERPIIHRDIKPQNLKLNRRGKIKLLDFGIAKSTDSSASTLSDQTFVGATLDYSPIEQILRAMDPTFREYILLKHRENAEQILRQNTDARCDLYSLGATFYHLLTKQPPEDAVKRTLDVWEDRPDPIVNPSALNPTVPLGISNCLMKAMAVDREARFASAFEMLKSLQDAIAQDKILESSFYNESSNAEKVRAQVDEEERRRERLLMQAQTSKLLAEDVPKIKNDERTSDVQSLPTEPLPTPPTAIPLSDTIPSAIDFGTESIATPLTGETVREDKKTDAYKVREVMPPQPVRKKTSSALWILVAAILGLMAIGSGVAVGLWIIIPDNGPDINAVSSPTPTVTPTPRITPTEAPTPLASPTKQIIEPSPSVEPTPDRTPRPTPQATTQRTPESTPRPTPSRTPRRTPTPRKITDPNCIYNNTCQ
ncbi:MAG TPA: serine/threonine-protein kinase [Pyrinomonadaceae bacterium]|nr:serine/threonine-protein kinase [Pyrinomonadaceae bacterium]